MPSSPGRDPDPCGALAARATHSAFYHYLGTLILTQRTAICLMGCICGSSDSLSLSTRHYSACLRVLPPKYSSSVDITQRNGLRPVGLQSSPATTTGSSRERVEL